MNRRELLKVAAVAMVSLAVLSGCTPQASNKAKMKAGGSAKHSALRAGAGTRIVNPVKTAVPIGHGSNKPLSDPVYADICTQAFAIEDEFANRIVWITCDFMQIPPEIADEIKKRIKKKYGIDPTAVCVHAIHNHASPPIIAREVVKPEYYDPEYAEFFLSQTVAVVGDAINRLEPAKLRYSEDYCTSVAINRRKKNPDGTVIRKFKPNNIGAVDFKVQVVVAESLRSGKPIVVMAEYASHPVVTAHKYLGGEYPSFFRKHVERKFPSATAMFFQGCAGNIRIQILSKDRESWVRGTPEDADRFGFDLADAAERAVAKAGKPIVGPIEAEYAEIQVPLNQSAGPNIPATMPFRIQAFRLGAASENPFTLMALGAEAFIEYSFELEKRLQPSNTIVIGYANDPKGYLPTAVAYDEGGYEPQSWREYWYNLPGPYSKKAENLILDAATELAKPK